MVKPIRVVSSKPKPSARLMHVAPREPGGKIMPSRVEIAPGPRPVHACDVVIPYHADNLRWLPASVESILNQNFARCIVHVIRDGFECKNDPAANYADLPNVRLYANDESIGPYRTLHRLWHRLETDYIAIQDSDDIALPNRIWLSIETLLREDADIVGGAMEQFLSHELAAEQKPDTQMFWRLQNAPYHRSGQNRWKLCPEGNVINGTMVMRKASFGRLGGFAPLKMSADMEWNTRSLRAGAKMVAVPDVVGLRRLHHTSLSHNKEYGAGSTRRNESHDYITKSYDRMTPGFNPREFGALARDRYEAHKLRPIHRNGRPQPRNLEYHVSHACNLACSNCSHYSDGKHSGMSSAAEAERQFGLWSDRLLPRKFSLVGGEPTLNPELGEIIEIARRHWPHAILQLVTNGFYLSRHPELPRILEETACRLEISVHHQSPEYQARLEPVRKLVASWETGHCLKVNWRESATQWRRTYQGFGREMRPFDDGDPQASWERCHSKWCPQIHDGKLWKCPQMAYLPMQAAKYGLEGVDEWKPYLAYTPLSAECSEVELREFLSRKAEPCCGACPAGKVLFELPLPLRGGNANAVS